MTQPGVGQLKTGPDFERRIAGAQQVLQFALEFEGIVGADPYHPSRVVGIIVDPIGVLLQRGVDGDDLTGDGSVGAAGASARSERLERDQSFALFDSAPHVGQLDEEHLAQQPLT